MLDRPRFRGLQHQSRLRALKLPDIEKRVALWDFFLTLCSSDIALRRVPAWDLAPYIHGDTVVRPQVTIPEALETFAGARIFGSVGSESVAPGLAVSTLADTKSQKTDM